MLFERTPTDRMDEKFLWSPGNADSLFVRSGAGADIPAEELARALNEKPTDFAPAAPTVVHSRTRYVVTAYQVKWVIGILCII